MDYSSMKKKTTIEKAKNEARKKREIRPLTSAPPERQKRSAAMDILKSFIKTDFATIRGTLVENVLRPRAIDMVSDAIDTAKNLALYGDPKMSRSSGGKKRGGSITSYDEYYKGEEASSSAYRIGNFDVDIYPIPSHKEATDILAQMREDVREYSFVSVADYYHYLGISDDLIEAVHHNYGWRNLDFVQIISGRHGYIIDLPKAEKFEEG